MTTGAKIAIGCVVVVFLASMAMVVLADDAFTFLFTWEFMSLSSWALVMAHDQVKENVRAGYVYLVMASFGTLALLLGFGLLAGANGNYAFDAIRASHPSAALAALVLILTGFALFSGSYMFSLFAGAEIGRAHV